MSTFYKFILAALLSCGLFTSSFATITHNATTTVGCQDAFTTSITGTNYQWNFGPNSYLQNQSGPGLKTASAAFLTPGSHTVRVLITTGSGVVGDSVTFNVVANSATATLTSNKPVCQVVNTSVTFTAGPSGFLTYAFFVNDSLKQLTAANTFTYPPVRGDSIRVFGYDGTCFTNGATLYDHTPEPPTVTASINSGDTICAGDPVTFTATPAAVGDSFLFYVGGSLNQSAPNNIWITSTLSDNSNIVAFVVNSFGCKNYFYSNTINVRVKPTPVVNLVASDSAICNGTSVTFTATTAQSNADLYTFAINNSTVQSNTNNTFTSTTLNNNDIVTVRASLNGCSSRLDSVIMAVVTTPIVNIVSTPADTACANSPVVFAAVPSAYANYHFFNNGQSVQNGPNSTYTTDSLDNGNGMYVVVSDPGCGTATSDTISLIITAGLTVRAGEDGVTCTNNDTIVLSGATPAGGTWSGPGITNDTLGVFNPATAGAGIHVLTYTASNSSGCTGTGTVTYVVSDYPLINIGNEVEICDDSVVLSVSGAGLTTSWSPDFGLSCTECASTTASPDVSTTYTVRITATATGCSNTDTVRVIANDLEVTAAFADTLIASGESVKLQATLSGGLGQITYDWNPTDNLTDINTLTPTASPATGTLYTIVARSGGCVDSASVLVRTQQADTATRIPSAFTPNGDNKNDVFAPVFKDVTNSAVLKTFHVFNRYGQLIHDASTGWDGRFKGVEQPTGTYVYYIAVQFPNEDEKHYQGSVTLIR